MLDALPSHAESAFTVQMAIPPGNSGATGPLTLGFECSSGSESSICTEIPAYLRIVNEGLRNKSSFSKPSNFVETLTAV